MSGQPFCIKGRGGSSRGGLTDLGAPEFQSYRLGINDLHLRLR